MAVLDRVKLRLTSEDVSDEIITEYIKTAEDRICLWVGVDTLAAPLESIVVEVVVKMHRRRYYEGISSESADTLNSSFVDNILEEYATELNSYKNKLANKGDDGIAARVVSFI